jgi:photosystem II stability/assembly factor-like uncharacterized protein
MLVAVSVGTLSNVEASTEAPETTWSSVSPVPPSASFLFGDLSCVNSNVCVAVSTSKTGAGVVIRTIDAARRWSVERVPHLTGLLNAVSCVASGTCVAVGRSLDAQESPVIVRSTDAGRTWMDVSVPRAVSVLNGAICTTANVCLLTGGLKIGRGLALVTTDGGREWSAISIRSVRWTGLAACSTPTYCNLEGANAAQTIESMFAITLNSRHVVSQKLPILVSLISGLACTHARRCIAVGQSKSASTILTSTVNGGEWSVAAIPSIPGLTLQSVDCAMVSRCFAVGDNSSGSGVSLATGNSGASWMEQRVPTSISEIDYLACPSATLCFGEGFNAAVNNEFFKLSA